MVYACPHALPYTCAFVIQRTTTFPTKHHPTHKKNHPTQERVLAAEASAAAAQGALDAAQQEIATLTTRTNTDATALTQALAHAQELEVTLASVRSEQEQLLSDKVQVIRMLEQQTESLQGHNAGLVTKVCGVITK